jgi:hypothetical protein
MSKFKAQLERHPITVTPAVRFLLDRVMRELLTRGTFQPLIDHERGDVYYVDIARLRIVIGKGMALAHRVGIGAGEARVETRTRR